MFIIALLPAHNEEDKIQAAIAGLRAQTRIPDQIIVVADNCTDRTVEVAHQENVDFVLYTKDNTDKKAGALNQALSLALRDLATDDLVLIQDADTVLNPNFIEVAVQEHKKNDNLGAVGGVFYGEEGSGLLGLLQRNEYHRYAREIKRKNGRVMVLSGTASVFRTQALLDILEHRGQVYDTKALTEDNEITLMLKTLGWDLISPEECSVVTEVMPTIGDLFRQRVRWQRGAVENLLNYGWTPITRKYWGQQAMIAVGVLALSLYLVLTVATVIITQQFQINYLWMAIGLIFVVEKVVTVWKGGISSRLIAAPLIVEIVYDLFIQFVFVYSIFQIVFKRKAVWGVQTGNN